MTLKEYLERVKNGEQLAIHTPTQEDYDKLMKKLDKTEVRWDSGSKPTELHDWSLYNAYTCARIDKNKILHFCLLEFYEDVGYPIIPFSDLTFGRIPNEDDISFTACTNAPSNKEITFEYYPTDEELHKILIYAVKTIFDVSEASAENMLTYSTPKQWAKVLADYIDGQVIESAIGLQDLYEIYCEQNRYTSLPKRVIQGH